MDNITHTHRYITRFIIEAETPLFVGSGDSSLLKDALVFKDVNGFPMIPGTSLAGVLRHALDTNSSNKEWSSIFGDKDTSGAASRLKVSAGLMMLSENKCSEGILQEEDIDQKTLTRFTNLPSRQHVRINEKGTAEKNGLFDNEIVYRGTRFIFEIELRGDKNDSDKWNELVKYIKNPSFRLGAGTRNGYGSLKVISTFNQQFDFQNELELNQYLDFNPSFNSKVNWINENEKTELDNSYKHFQLNLTPDSFFIFSEGFGDDDVDNKPLEEEIVKYNSNGIEFIPNNTVIPASSIKGAISHRVAFHYNKLNENFGENGKVGTDNLAVYELFGDMSGSKSNSPKAGNVFLNDIYIEENKIANNKIFNHVAIDRFTGGALNGALFSEKVSNLLEGSIQLSIYVKNEEYSKNVVEAFQLALIDVCKGLLPLGGMTTKGNGMFTGTFSINGKEEFNYLKQTEECQA
jgi:CRISPR/Cas system CSM-associated protein Csm3 (group 7 of RAMP superfamily)